MGEMPQPEQPKRRLFGNQIRWAINAVRAFRDELRQEKLSEDDLHFSGVQIKEGSKRFQPKLIDRTHGEKYYDLVQTPLDKEQEAALNSLRQKLEEVLEPDSIDGWIVQSIPAFGGKRPIDIVLTNDPEGIQAIDDMIARIRSGDTYL